MKRKQLIRYLRSQGCEMLREGSSHSWWFNPQLNKRSAIPRHTGVIIITIGQFSNGKKLPNLY
jgi:mRNA interferase HicA